MEESHAGRQRLVFVGGLHRSGTTPLTNVIASHPLATGLTGTGVPENEGVHLQSVYPRIREYGGMGAFARDDRAHLTDESPLATPSHAAALIEAWSPYWDMSKPLLVEKSPSNLIMGRYLQALFPTSSLIVVVRHPVVVALATAKWDPLVISRNGRRHVGFYDHIANWVRAHEILREDASFLRSLHVLRYEDLITDPVGDMGKIQRFLGLDEPFDISSLRGGRSDAYIRAWNDMRTHPLRRRTRRRVGVDFGDRVRALGYDLTDLDFRAPWVPSEPT